MGNRNEKPDGIPDEALLWLIDLLAEAITANGDRDRWSLISDLRAKTGYACADAPLDPASQAGNDRVALIERLSAQLANEEERAGTAR